MNGNNEHIDVLIFRFLDKTATEQESAELLDWVNTQTQNKLYFQQVSKQFVALTSSSIDFDANKAWDKNAGLDSNKPSSILPKTKTLIAVLALVVLVAGVAWWYFQTSADNKIETATPVIDVYRSTDSIREIVLSDGVKLTLDAHTELFVTKQAERNIINVNGKALVQVPKAVGNYEVETQGGTCKLNEGCFQLEHDKDAKTLKVKVVEGNAAVNTDNSPEQIVLTKNDAVSVLNGKVVEKDTLINENYLAWKTGVLEFDNTPLSEAIPQIAEYYKKDIEISTPGLENCLLNAKLDRYSFDEVKIMFEIAFQAKMSSDSCKVYISGTACK